MKQRRPWWFRHHAASALIGCLLLAGCTVDRTFESLQCHVYPPGAVAMDVGRTSTGGLEFLSFDEVGAAIYEGGRRHGHRYSDMHVSLADGVLDLAVDARWWRYRYTIKHVQPECAAFISARIRRGGESTQ